MIRTETRKSEEEDFRWSVHSSAALSFAASCLVSTVYINLHQSDHRRIIGRPTFEFYNEITRNRLEF